MKKISTPHSDENPEAGDGSGTDSPLLSEESSAIDDLYKKEKRLGVRPDENVIYYEEFVPYVDHGHDRQQ